jgi:homoserine dehydrogenase
VRGERVAGRVRVSVAPERLPAGDPLAGAGSDSALVLETDLMGEIALIERGGTVDQTAYGLLADLLALVTPAVPPAGARRGRAARPADPRRRRVP